MCSTVVNGSLFSCSNLTDRIEFELIKNTKRVNIPVKLFRETIKDKKRHTGPVAVIYLFKFFFYFPSSAINPSSNTSSKTCSFQESSKSHRATRLLLKL